MRIFIDTNILLDLTDSKRPNNGASACIFQTITDHLLEAVTSTQSLVDCAYVLRKAPVHRVREFLHTILNVVEVTSITGNEMKAALSSKCTDIEDAVQMMCAENSCCDIIVTASKKDFEGHSKIPVYSPSELLEEMYSPR